MRRTILALTLAFIVMGVWSSAQRSLAPPDSVSGSQDPDAPAPRTGAAASPRVVVIDPGHGGTDVGVVGPGGVQEKTLTLEIARRVKALVESRLGLRAVLTRDDDRDVTLDQRAGTANAAQADLFVSLHLNASTSPVATGAEIYLLKAAEPTEGGDDASQPTLVLPLARGGTRTVTFVAWAKAQARHRESALRLADLLQASLKERVPLGQQPVIEAPMRLLAGLDMPAVLLELAYLTNPEQAGAAQGEDFQSSVADAITGAIGGYRAMQGVEREP